MGAHQETASPDGVMAYMNGIVRRNLSATPDATWRNYEAKRN